MTRTLSIRSRQTLSIGPTGSDGDGWMPGIAPAVRRRVWWVVFTAILACAAGCAYLYKATPLYTSASRLLVEPFRPRLLGEAQPSLTFDETTLFLGTQKAVLTSVPVLTIASQSLAETQASQGSALSEAVAVLKKQVRVNIGRKDSIITVEYDSPSAAVSARVVNAVVNAYLAYQSDQQHARTMDMLGILNREKAGCDVAITEKRASMSELQRSVAAVSFDGGDGSVVRTLQSLKEALIIARLDAAGAAAAYAQALASCRNDAGQMRRIEELEQAGGVAAAPEAEAVSLRTSIADLEQQMQELLIANACLPQHPRVRSLKNRIDHLRAAQVVSLKRRMMALQGREALLADSVRQQSELVAQFTENASKYSKLDTELKQLERHSETLDQRIKELNAAKSAGALNIRVLEPAAAAQRSSKPVKAQIIGISLLGGLLLGTIMACLREWTDRRFRSPEHARMAIDLPVLGVVPRMRGCRGDAVGNQAVRPAMLPETAEAYRAIRTAIACAGVAEAGRRLLITAPAAGDGASTVTSNLAIAIAQTGRRVLVIDANLRHPSQHRHFGLNLQRGVSGILLGEETPEQAVQRTTIEGVDVVSCGPDAAASAEMVQSPRMAEALDRLSARYDVVLLDAPATGCSSDARAMARLCHGVLLVVRISRTDRETAVRAHEGLLGVGADVLGMVINGVRRPRVADVSHFEVPAIEYPTHDRPALRHPGQMEQGRSGDATLQEPAWVALPGP